MSASDILSFATPTDAIRIFIGYRQAAVTQPAFYTQLGQTFMPGTPYMLAPLGLAAYLPGVLADAPGDLPHEFALICWPTPDVWQNATKNTLRGRVYTQTHGGVYASPASTAAFPVMANALSPNRAAPFYLFDANVDWQQGVTHVAVVSKRDAQMDGPTFRSKLREALVTNSPAWKGAGIDQSVVWARDNFAVIWVHHTDERAGFGQSDLSFASALITIASVLRNERVICLDEPPVLNITTSAAYNFVFLREAKFFLR